MEVWEPRGLRTGPFSGGSRSKTELLIQPAWGTFPLSEGYTARSVRGMALVGKHICNVKDGFHSIM